MSILFYGDFNSLIFKLTKLILAHLVRRLAQASCRRWPLVPKVVTWHDLKRRNGHYSAWFAKFGYCGAQQCHGL